MYIKNKELEIEKRYDKSIHDQRTTVITISGFALIIVHIAQPSGVKYPRSLSLSLHLSISLQCYLIQNLSPSLLPTRI